MKAGWTAVARSISSATDSYPASRSADSTLSGPRHRQRVDHEDVLVRQLQWLPAGGKHPQLGHAVQQAVDKFRAGRQQVLAVVEHQQHPPARQVAGQLLRGGLSRLVLDPESRRDGVGEVEGIID